MRLLAHRNVGAVDPDPALDSYALAALDPKIKVSATSAFSMASSMVECCVQEVISLQPSR